MCRGSIEGVGEGGLREVRIEEVRVVDMGPDRDVLFLGGSPGFPGLARVFCQANL